MTNLFANMVLKMDNIFSFFKFFKTEQYYSLNPMNTIDLLSTENVVSNS